MSKVIAAVLLVAAALAGSPAVDGPYNGFFIADGNGLKKPMSNTTAKQWTISCWVDWNGPQTGSVLIGGFGAPDKDHRYLAVVDGRLAFSTSSTNYLVSDTLLAPHQPQWLAASFDGSQLTLFLNQKQILQKALVGIALTQEMHLAPYFAGTTHFAGKLAHFQVSDAVSVAMEAMPPMELINFEAGSESWPFQTRAQAGYKAPQPPATLPRSAAPISKPVATPPYAGPVFVKAQDEEVLAGGWKMAAVPSTNENVAQISAADFKTDSWYAATVPGTVLTTLIDRGVYPDPAYGLNNMDIPESLNKQDYWYRTEFERPALRPGERPSLTFHGINYRAQVWLNGNRLGEIKGAFMRGIFDVANVLHAGKNVLLVRISPPPHPGIPQEQSMQAGPGENGGSMCLDGPTFVATEGWDWIPAVRDRNIGIWQRVTLKITRNVSIGDAQVITTLPLPDTSRASIVIHVPLKNSSPAAIAGALHGEFEGVSFDKKVTIQPGENLVTLTPSEFAQLNITSPRLWWPNGYGRQELYHLTLAFENSDRKTVRFGIRDISYELSLMDHTGNLRRVEVAPAHAENSKPLVDVTHEAIVHSNRGWVYSLDQAAEHSPAVHPLTDTKLTPFLVIRVNGVRIAAKGGSWGMDDFRKRVSREHLEPYFRLHRDANLNIIRNWVGQSTEEVFYDLADEYGLLVWNDFWQSTQNYNVEPTDTALFLANARDTILRFRNHPSIVLWCGRNEGVPAPALNVALDELIRETDGTRFYAPSSNTINLQDSGPYRYYDPADYFTKFDRGFSVEVGIPSFPTLKAFQSYVPESEQWPISDTWAYHDWHQSGNGVMAPFMTALEAHYGPANSLIDFDRKAQLMNYVGHRALFEGMNANLWTSNSGRMLWMTQPAWPSTVWQILSSDYDTQASFYGVKVASEPLHIQMNLPDLQVAVVNNTAQTLNGLMARVRLFGLDGQLRSTKEQKLDARAVGVSKVFDLGALIGGELVFVKLELLNSASDVLSQNFYWYASKPEAYQPLNQLPESSVKMTAIKGDGFATVTLDNISQTISLMNRITLQNAVERTRVLPAYYSDNYISLLPGERRQIRIEYPNGSARDSVQVDVSGWNQKSVVVGVQ